MAYGTPPATASVHSASPSTMRTPSRTTARRQQMHSCDICRRRKVRCDSVNERPCTACKKAEVACRFTVGWRRRRGRPRTPDDDVEASRRSPLSTVSTLTSPDVSSEDAATVGVAPPESEVALSINMAENGLLRFFRDGLSSMTWGVFDMLDNVRVTYTGTHISNMTHLIKLDRPRPQYLVYPYPQIRPPLSASQAASSSTAAPGSAPGTIPIPSLPAVRDIHSFPEKEIRDDFIDAYFDKVNPYFPVVDEADFRARYADPHNQPALVVLHAVLLVGAHVSTHTKAVQARHLVKAVLFRRAKCVFDLRHEHDRLHLVQAALLFTWHLQNGDTASCNSFYWLGVACRIAFGIGMHRDLMKDPLEPDRMPLADRRMWRRIWWTLFQAEVLSALEHGRPPAIRRDDFDQAPLERDDFCQVNGCFNPKVQVAYCLRQNELCLLALDVVGLSAPGRRPDEFALKRTIDDLNAQLVRWMLAATTTKTDAFGEIALRLTYHTVVIHLYRLTDSEDNEYARIGTSASADIVARFETLHEKRLLAQCPCSAVTTLTAAAIHLARDVQQCLAAHQPLLAVHALCLLDRACVAAEHLSVFWPNVEGVRKVFRSLYERYTTALHGRQHETADNFLPEEHLHLPEVDDFAGVDWTDILGLTWQVGHVDVGPWDASLFGIE